MIRKENKMHVVNVFLCFSLNALIRRYKSARSNRAQETEPDLTKDTTREEGTDNREVRGKTRGKHNRERVIKRP